MNHFELTIKHLEEKILSGNICYWSNRRCSLCNTHIGYHFRKRTDGYDKFLEENNLLNDGSDVECGFDPSCDCSSRYSKFSFATLYDIVNWYNMINAESKKEFLNYWGIGIDEQV